MRKRALVIASVLALASGLCASADNGIVNLASGILGVLSVGLPWGYLQRTAPQSEPPLPSS
ncbi:hypothetical protein [Streptomyces violaceusniger]|uniref:hypothetical protein n=1 Tax=Streptomyces violaceusniger TaxID=68280 RepID=UPI003825EFBE